MKCFLLAVFFMIGVAGVTGQSSTTDWLHPNWSASWITMPGISGKEYGVYHFRKAIELAAVPAHFNIRVSADNRYRLFVNGHPAGAGPAQGSPQQWFYDVYDIAPWLHAGSNAIAAQVWNYGESGPWVQMSVKTGLIVQGETDAEKMVNTDASWKVQKDTSCKILPIDYTRIWDFIIVTPGDDIDARSYAWNWQVNADTLKNWQPARALVKGTPQGTGTDLWWQLVLRPVPYLVEDTLHVAAVRQVTGGLTLSPTAFVQKNDVTVPAATRVTILLDQGKETTAIPELLLSGGADAVVTVSYAESLMDKNHDKGNRNDITGKELLGVSDRYTCDGGIDRLFCPLWFRAYRYVQLDIQTAATPLTIRDFYGRFDHPAHPTASFETSSDTLNAILQTAWHTQEVCTKDYLLTDAYYEQLQYTGDNRIQGLVLHSMGYDSALVKNTLMQFYMSRIPEGLTQSRFPCAIPQVIPTYSLLWISMLHDYWKYYRDDEFLRNMLPAAYSIIDWYEKRIDRQTGLIGKTPYFNFVDWTKEWAWDNDKAIGGVPAGANTGGSSIITMQLAYALRDVADLYDYIGDDRSAKKYRALATTLTQAVWKTCWDNQRQLLSDTPDKTEFSQHANIFGVLTNTIPAALQKKTIRRVANDTSIIQSSVYFRFYLGQAYVHAGLADEYEQLLDPWKNMLQEGLTTFAEVPGHARSDCHPWSCSPLYAFYSTICGINPTGPGFTRLQIRPALGHLQWIKASMAYHGSAIHIDLQKAAAEGIRGAVSLPPSVHATFFWKSREVILHPGLNKISIAGLHG